MPFNPVVNRNEENDEGSKSDSNSKQKNGTEEDLDNGGNVQSSTGNDLYLGHELDSGDEFHYPFERTHQQNLMTGIYGMSGSGKTGLTKILIEELTSNSVSSFVISPASDFYSLLDLSNTTSERSLKLENVKQVQPLSFSEGSGLPIHFPIFNLPTKEETKNMIQKGDMTSTTLDLMIERIATTYVNVAHSTASRNKTRSLNIFYNQLIKEAFNRDYPINTVDQLERLIRSDLGKSLLRKLGLERLKQDIILGIEDIRTGQTQFIFASGWPLDFNEFSKQREGRTPINILAIDDYDVSDQNKIIGTFAEQLLTWAEKKGTTKAIRTVLIIDEAHNFCPKGNKLTAAKLPIQRLVREGRKYGLVVVLTSQLPRDLDSSVRSNLGIICIGKSDPNEVREVFKDIQARSNSTAEIDQIYDLKSREFVWSDSYRTNAFRSRDLFTLFDGHNKTSFNEAIEWLQNLLPEKPTEIENFTITDEMLVEIENNQQEIEVLVEENEIEILHLTLGKEIREYEREINESIIDLDRDVEVTSKKVIYLPFLVLSAMVEINSQPTIELDGKTISPFNADIFKQISLENLFNYIEDEGTEIWLTKTQLTELTHYFPEDVKDIWSNLEPKLPGSDEQQPESLNHIIESPTLQQSKIIKSIQSLLDFYISDILPDIIDTEKTITKSTRESKMRQLLHLKLSELKKIIPRNRTQFIKQYEEVVKETLDWQKKINKMKDMGIDISTYKETTDRRLNVYDQMKNRKDQIEKLETEITSLKQEISKLSESQKKSKQHNRPSNASAYFNQLKNWSFSDKQDSIDEIEFDLLYIPYVLIKGHLSSEIGEEFIAVAENHKGSYLYISCSTCISEATTDTQLHEVVWLCANSNCTKLLCQYHSTISKYSDRRVCSLHLGTCEKCGGVESDQLKPCTSCNRKFCLNHIGLVSKLFGKDKLVCVECQD